MDTGLTTYIGDDVAKKTTKLQERKKGAKKTINFWEKTINSKAATKHPRKTTKKPSEKLNKKLLITLIVVLIIFGISVFFALRKVTTTETVTREESDPVITQYVDDDSLELGTTKTVQEGSEGTKLVYYEVRKNFYGEELSSNIIREDITKKSTPKIIHQGTKKWQYMYCSDGSYRYFTDEEFKDKNTGFTHSSDDFCAQNGQGSVIGLANSPPDLYGDIRLDPSYTPIYADLSSLDYLGKYDNYYKDTSRYNSNEEELREAQEKAELSKRQAYVATQNACRSEADNVREKLRNLLRVLGAAGASGSSEYVMLENSIPQEINSAYNNCMRRNGY